MPARRSRASSAWAAARGLRALTAEVFQDNPASIRVLTRAGFAYEGEGEIYSLARGAMVPTLPLPPPARGMTR